MYLMMNEINVQYYSLHNEFQIWIFFFRLFSLTKNILFKSIFLHEKEFFLLSNLNLSNIILMTSIVSILYLEEMFAILLQKKF